LRAGGRTHHRCGRSAIGCRLGSRCSRTRRRRGDRLHGLRDRGSIRSERRPRNHETSRRLCEGSRRTSEVKVGQIPAWLATRYRGRRRKKLRRQSPRLGQRSRASPGRLPPMTEDPASGLNGSGVEQTGNATGVGIPFMRFDDPLDPEARSHELVDVHGEGPVVRVLREPIRREPLAVAVLQ
jgi:hypothetical protein